MSSDNRDQQERRLDDERCVDALLAEGGFPDDAELRDVLLRLRSLRVDEVPPPSAELAALLGQPGAADVVHLDEWSRKRPRKKRVVFTTLAVAASLGAAGGAAAGNDALRRQAEGTISSIVNSLSPDSGVAPSPAPPSTAPAVPTAVVPSGVPPAGTVPAGPSPVGVPTAELSVGERPGNPEAPGRSSRAPHDAAVPSVVPQTGPHTGGKPAEPGSPESFVPSPAGQPGVGQPGAGQPSAGQPSADRAEPLTEGKEKDKGGSDGH